MTSVKITLIRSRIGASKRQKGTLDALGLGKRMSQVVKVANPQINGMISKVSHLIKVEEA